MHMWCALQLISAGRNDQLCETGEREFNLYIKGKGERLLVFPKLPSKFITGWLAFAYLHTCTCTRARTRTRKIRCMLRTVTWRTIAIPYEKTVIAMKYMACSNTSK